MFNLMSKKITFDVDKIVSFTTEEGTEYVRVTRERTNTEGVRFKEVTFEPKYFQLRYELGDPHMKSALDSVKAYDKDYL